VDEAIQDGVGQGGIADELMPVVEGELACDDGGGREGHGAGAGPAADLAVATAIASSLRGQPVRADAVLIGEVGLSGELRMVGQMPARLREAAKLGFRAAIVPRRLRRGEPWPDDIQIIEARSLRQALEQALLGGVDKSD